MPEVELILGWLRAFALTQAIEIGVYAQATTRPRRERLAIAFAASAITHPIVWFVIPPVTRALLPTGSWRTDWYVSFAFAESFAVAAEAGWFVALGVRARDAVAYSFLANAISVVCGLFCYRYLGW